MREKESDSYLHIESDRKINESFLEDWYGLDSEDLKKDKNNSYESEDSASGLKTTSTIAHKPEKKIEEPKQNQNITPIEQKQSFSPDHLNMIKTSYYREAINTDLVPNEEGIIEKEILQRINNQLVKGIIKIQRAVKEAESILLFKLDSSNLIATNPISPYDGKVFKSICTLLDEYICQHPNINYSEECQIPMTVQQIYNAMGFPGKRLSPANKKKIIKSVLKMGTTYLWCDWTNELNVRKLDIESIIDEWGDNVIFMKRAQYMLNVEPAEIIPPKSRKNKNGEKLAVDGFIINKIPFLFVQAKILGHIAQVPINWFEIKSFDRVSDERNSILQALSERVATAIYYKKRDKNPNTNNYNLIVFDKLFKEIGMEATVHRNKRNRLIKDIEIILKEFKEDKGIIRYYEFIESNRKLYGVRFFV